MDLHEKTKYKFAEAIKSLMQYHELDKITVTDIVKVSQMTRQTFYRYFKDKYDLVNWYFEELAKKSFKQMDQGLTLKEGLTKKFQFIEEELVFFKQAFKSNDYNSLVQYDYQCIYLFYKEMISKRNLELTPELDFLLQMYCHGSIDMTIQWINLGRPISIDQMTGLLIEAIPTRLKEILIPQ